MSEQKLGSICKMEFTDAVDMQYAMRVLNTDLKVYIGYFQSLAHRMEKHFPEIAAANRDLSTQSDQSAGSGAARRGRKFDRTLVG